MSKTLIALALFASLNAFAAEQGVLDCQGANIEGAGISIVNGRLEGSIMWDCFPGDGICKGASWLTETRDENGDIVFAGESFELTMYSDSNGYIKAIGNESPAGGRSLTYAGEVSCKRAQPANNQ